MAAFVLASSTICSDHRSLHVEAIRPKTENVSGFRVRIVDIQIQT